ncbi:MAG: [Fe-Fe] hydrogenase large subunit C-terminal domain-containing protein [Cellulosilyticaceae bacterium]
MRVMNFSSTNCKNCYKCVRTCAVKAIEIKNDKANIVAEKCVACGHCLMVCPQNARDIKSSLGAVKQAIQEGRQVVVSLAPSYRAYFEESEKFVAALRKIGFKQIQETAIGAEIVSSEYEKYIMSSEYTEFITTCCPSTVRLIERYYADLIHYMIPIVSPMLAHGRVVKAINAEAYTVFIGPCISKIYESISESNQNDIDAVLTFDEVTNYMEELGVDYKTLEGEKVDACGTLRGHKYPVVGGVLNGIRHTLEHKGLEVLRVHGMAESKEVLEALKEGKLKNVCIEINICNESCIAGPGGINQEGNVFTRIGAIQKFIRNQRKQELNNCFIDNPILEGIDFNRTFVYKQIEFYKPTEEEIVQILQSIGKHTKEDELNCAACGYNTCREKAIAVLNGMSQIDMCLPYMRSVAERLSNEIFNHSPNCILMLDHQCRIVDINPKAEEIFHDSFERVRGQDIGILMDREPFVNAIASKQSLVKQKITLDAYKFSAYRDIAYLEKQNALLVIFADITEQERKKQELGTLKGNLLEVTQTIIDKQMRVAQEIASLLGETTAETKVAIIELKKVLQQEEDC